MNDYKPALKRFGQNFLIDKNILDIIISRSDLNKNDCVLEIGAGKGFLTQALLETNIKFLNSIEIDERFKPELSLLERNHKNFRVYWSDAMNFDYENLQDMPNKIIANIPYNITTPLIWKLLNYASKGFTYHLYMVQKEAAERLTAKSNSKARYPLGVTLEAMGKANIIKNVSRKCFRPIPKVESCLIEIVIDKNFELGSNKIWNEFLHKAFSQRRKTLINNLAGFMNFTRENLENILSDLNVNLKIRAEDLDCETWLELYGYLAQNY